nr:hypothetical protein [Ningiella ruwaisensis]
MIIKLIHFDYLGAWNERSRLKKLGFMFDIKPHANGWRLVRQGWRYNNG